MQQARVQGGTKSELEDFNVDSERGQCLVIGDDGEESSKRLEPMLGWIACCFAGAFAGSAGGGVKPQVSM